MQRSERELTDVEIMDAYEDILTLIESAYNSPVRKEFEKQSRCEQAGYDIITMLLKRRMLDPGIRDEQMNLSFETQEQKNGKE